MVIDTSDDPGLWIVGFTALFMVLAGVGAWLGGKVGDLEDRIRRNRR